ncbi:MAG: heme o synthase, partial [Bdellovibrionales bacterium]|nr:heme o synthase [Bdellovibrionales bacterium]
MTKPRVMSLLLISTACPMVLAGGGSVPAISVFWALLGGALVTGSASAINCIWDRDIDAIMQRTQNRPMAAGRISTRAAAVFSFAIGFAGLLVLAVCLNVAAAATALFGHLFYVLVYTMWLKRSTPQNIVIGGAAGAVPPLVGWVAVSGSLDLTAALIFFVVFLWTPPHFWALALNKNEDYQRAGVPMLPVVAGAEATHTQMLVYALALIPVSVLLVLSNPLLGWFSMVVL